MKQLIILKENVGSIRDASTLFKKIKKINIDYAQENFMLFYLDTKNKIIDSEVLFKGGLNACLICPKTLFRSALKHNANSLIIAHNHPSGDVTPSYEDKDIFERLKEAGELIQMKVLDCIIFNQKEFYSLKDGDDINTDERGCE